MGEEGRPRGMGDLTQMPISCGQGDRAALDALLPLVYDELRVIARSYLRQATPRGPTKAASPGRLIPCLVR